uniref:Exonuclease domain-containing protein n=1 Tax=Heterorhabditis bacteriophora TaxID=37862 RepID=A0A1I7XIG2_HETBA
MNKRKLRQVNKLKKQISELFLLGNTTEEEAQQINASESQKESASASHEMLDDSHSRDTGNFHERDGSMKISRKLAIARRQRLPGPQLTLTLDRLGGVYMSHPEIRDLVQFSVIGPVVAKPKWVHFRPWKSTSQTILIRVNCPNNYIVNNPHSFSFMDTFFEKQWIRMDSDVGDRDSFWKHIMQVPVSMQEQIRERVLKMDPLKGTDQTESLKTELLLTSADMVEHTYPFPDEEFIATKDRYIQVTMNSPLFAIDCEMCVTTAGVHELTRISLIREDGKVVLDTLVKPENKITDYLTKFSGITPKMMESVTISLSDVQNALRACLPPDAILCGHSLEFDLRAMKMAHPYCIDVGVAYNLSGSERMKTSLKNLMSLFLGETIQDGSGHCSVEDSWAAMRLIKMKLQNGLIFGNCRYGWDYDRWSQGQKHKVESCGDVDVDCEVRAKRKRNVKSFSPKFCSCGERLGIDCILEDCQCQIASPDLCIKCLMKQNIVAEDGIDWRFKVRYPSSFPSIDEYMEEISCDLLDYGLALIELDFMNREQEIPSDDEREEGEVKEHDHKMQHVVQEIDSYVERLIRTAARYSLIILVLSSDKTSICYLKVKQ